MRWVTVAVSTMLLMAMAARGVEAPSASTQPSAVATTLPTTRTIHGTVDYQGGLSFRKPDLTRIVLYLASDKGLDALPVQKEPYVVAQRDRAFVPNFIVIPKGAKVDFPNWDHFDHNVFSRSAAAPAFDLDRYPYLICIHTANESSYRRFACRQPSGGLPGGAHVIRRGA